MFNDCRRTAVETLLNKGFVPTRSIVLAFGERLAAYQLNTIFDAVIGMDEENGGTEVSDDFIFRLISHRPTRAVPRFEITSCSIMERTDFRSWSTKDVSLFPSCGATKFNLLGEPTAQFGERNGVIFATPSVAEKGMINVNVEVTAPGGHSMLPPRHTVCVAFLCRAPCLLMFL